MFIDNRLDYLNNYIEELAKQGVFPGASYALVTNDDIYVNSSGKKQILPEELNISNDTIFDLASLTKPIATTTSILMLIEKGLLTLNTKVKNILPDYKYEDITIKQLITHTAGYPPEPSYRFDMNHEELKKAIFNTVPNYLIKDKEVIYSDVGFILLGLIIEKITGSFAVFAEQNIFSPLEMKDTCFNPGKENLERCAPTEYCGMRNRLVCGEVHDEKAYILEGIAGHAGLFSTAQDLAKFAQMILNNGIYKEKVILTKNSVDLIFQAQTKHLNSNRSIGWDMKDDDSSMGDLASENSIYHTGFTGGSILIDKKYNKAVIFLSNRVHPSRNNMKLIYYRARINNAAMAAIY